MFKDEFLPEAAVIARATQTDSPEERGERDLAEFGRLNRRIDRLQFWFGFAIGNLTGAVLAIAGMTWILSK